MAIPFAPPQSTFFIQGDSGVFLYIGQHLLQGDVPYVNCWDNKPPAVYFLNALGLLMGGLWGVWSIGLLALMLAVALCWHICEREYGPIAALFGLCCFATSMVHTLENPNLTEVYALPLQFGLFALFVQGSGSRSALMAGILASALFGLRQNIGTAAAVVILAMLLRPAWLETRKHWACFLGGAVGTMALPVLYFAAHGALRAAYDASIRGVLQSGVAKARWAERFRSLSDGIKLTSPFWTCPFALAGLVRPRGRLVWLAVLDLVLEALLSCLPGYGYPHYFLTWTPALAVLAAHAASVAISKWPVPARLATAAFSVFLAVGLLFGLADQRQRVSWRDPQLTVLVDYIRASTNTNDKIFVWGHSPDVYLLSGRECPTRFFDQCRFVQRKAAPQLVAEVAETLQRTRPTLVVETPYLIFPPIESARRAVWTNPSSEPSAVSTVEPLLQQIETNYIPEPIPGVTRWRLYRLNRGVSLPRTASEKTSSPPVY